MKSILLFLAVFEATSPLLAQNYDGLLNTQIDSINIHYSEGQKERAGKISERLANALKYHSDLLGFKPSVTLLVLSKTDWNKFTNFPVYGMPHYNNNKTLIVAAEDNDFWKSFLPPLDQLPDDLESRIETAYRDSEGMISMQPFFDLLAIHELGHAFHLQIGANMQRKWMGELFANILLHTYVAEKEPSALPALTTFPKMVIGNGSTAFKFTTLKELDEYYEEIGKNYPENYGWYQSRWHAAAANTYDNEGKSAGKLLFDALQSKKEKLNDQDLINLLEKFGLSSVIGMIQNWDEEVLKER